MSYVPISRPTNQRHDQTIKSYAKSTPTYEALQIDSETILIVLLVFDLKFNTTKTENKSVLQKLKV